MLSTFDLDKISNIIKINTLIRIKIANRYYYLLLYTKKHKVIKIQKCLAHNTFINFMELQVNLIKVGWLFTAFGKVTLTDNYLLVTTPMLLNDHISYDINSFKLMYSIEDWKYFEQKNTYGLLVLPPDKKIKYLLDKSREW